MRSRSWSGLSTPATLSGYLLVFRVYLADLKIAVADLRLGFLEGKDRCHE